MLPHRPGISAPASTALHHREALGLLCISEPKSVIGFTNQQDCLRQFVASKRPQCKTVKAIFRQQDTKHTADPIKERPSTPRYEN